MNRALWGNVAPPRFPFFGGASRGLCGGGGALGPGGSAPGPQSWAGEPGVARLPAGWAQPTRRPPRDAPESAAKMRMDYRSSSRRRAWAMDSPVSLAKRATSSYSYLLLSTP